MAKKMKMHKKLFSGAALVAALASLGLVGFAQQSMGAEGSGDLVPLNLKLPAEAFKGTPKDIKTNAYTEPYPDKPRPPMMVPAICVARA